MLITKAVNLPALYSKLRCASEGRRKELADLSVLKFAYSEKDGGNSAEDFMQRISAAAVADGSRVPAEAVEGDQRGRHGTSKGADYWRAGPTWKRIG